MRSYVVIGSIINVFVCLVACHEYKGFDDSILFKINWPGNDKKVLEETFGQDTLMVTTHNKEKYKCSIPDLSHQPNESDVFYDGPAPFDLVAALFSASTCSYRMESYWTYEVCHGNYIKQFHEEREGKKIKVQEYFLGKWDEQKTNDLRAKLEEAERDGDKLKYTKIDGVNMPFLELEMTDGTHCDLNNEHRTTKVQYVCYPHGKNEVYSLKETSTCNYEVTILTPALCSHPNFKPQAQSDNAINCVPVTGSPNKPRSLLMMEVDSMKKLLDVSRGFQRRVTVVKLDPKDGTLKAEIIKDDYMPLINKAVAEAMAEAAAADKAIPTAPKTTVVSSTVDDTSPVIDFLEGKHCLTGGTGWWKYEFCYGRYVRQFHFDKNGETSVMLGYFNDAAHKNWLKENPQKRPRPAGQRTFLTHFYQDGTVCDKTGVKRQTEVKLKCMENSSSLTKVSLYLMEPQTCQYILGVESPLICDIIQRADDDGLVPKTGDSTGEGETDKDNEESKETDADKYYVGNAIVEDFDVRFGND